jgi:uncharacterized DUF497 family protein
MEDRRIVWDDNKNAENRRKHGIGFETARFVFADPERLWRIDRSEKTFQARSAGNPLVWPRALFL